MLFQATGIAKSFGDETVLSNVTIQVNERERIGIVGVNGAGKSTLLKIISGEMMPDAGEIFRKKDITVGYLAQTGEFGSTRTVGEVMRSPFSRLLEMERQLRQLEKEMAREKGDAAGESPNTAEITARYDVLSRKFKEEGGYEMEAKIRSVMHGLGLAGIPQDTPVGVLSGGQKTRLALAKLLLTSPDLLLLDEPTNHLDLPALTWLEDFLRGFPGAVVVVSHDRYFLDALVRTVYEIERHTCKKYAGNYTRYLQTKAAETERQWKEYENQQKQIEKMEDFIRRNIARASTSARAKSRRKALERMVLLEKPPGEGKKAGIVFEIEKTSGNDVLAVKNLSAALPDGTPLFRDLSFQMRRGERVALIGPNGTGKSTLLKILTGLRSPDGGEIRWGANIKIGYYEQEQADLHPENTVLEEVWSAFPHLEEVRIRTVLGHYLFSGDDVKKKISALSGGEKARVALAKLMLKKANVLLLDEPTNHLDVHSREALEAALSDFAGTVLFVSHDRYFLNKMAHRILELSRDGLHETLGNYDDWLEKKKGAGQPPEDAAEPAPLRDTQPDGYEEAKRLRREEKNRLRKMEKLEEAIAGLEKDIAELEEKMASPEVGQDYVALMELQNEADEKKRQLEQYYSEWEQLASLS